MLMTTQPEIRYIYLLLVSIDLIQKRKISSVNVVLIPFG